MTETNANDGRVFAKCPIQGCKFRLVLAPGADWTGCPTHPGQGVWVESVRGTFDADKVCDARCRMSLSPKCRCSCGGTEHGAGSAQRVVKDC